MNRLNSQLQLGKLGIGTVSKNPCLAGLIEGDFNENERLLMKKLANYSLIDKAKTEQNLTNEYEDDALNKEEVKDSDEDPK